LPSGDGVSGGDFSVDFQVGVASVAPVVTNAVPGGGAPVAPPQVILLTFSEDILASSLDVGDLVLDGGGTVDSVEVIDGNTAIFHVTIPPVDATIHYSLAADALTDLQGTGNAAFAGEFTVDAIRPAIIAHAPTGTVAAPLREVFFTFSEPIDPLSFTPGDVVLTDPHGRQIPFGVSVTISSAGLEAREVRLSFPGLTEPGTYTVTLGPDIRDLAGNSVGSEFTASFDVVALDLVVAAVAPPSSVHIGESMTVTWTVTNTGEATGTEAWFDRIILSNGTPIEDIVLATLPAPAQPLAPGQSYTLSATISTVVRNPGRKLLAHRRGQFQRLPTGVRPQRQSRDLPDPDRSAVARQPAGRFRDTAIGQCLRRADAGELGRRQHRNGGDIEPVLDRFRLSVARRDPRRRRYPARIRGQTRRPRCGRELREFARCHGAAWP
jgi:hypothetical protein